MEPDPHQQSGMNSYVKNRSRRLSKPEVVQSLKKRDARQSWICCLDDNSPDSADFESISDGRHSRCDVFPTTCINN